MGNFFWKGPTTFALCALYYKKDAPKCKSFQYSYFSDATGQYCEFSKMHCKCSPPASLLRSRESIDAILEKASPMWITANRITTTTSAALFLLTLMYRRQLSQTESEPQPSRKCSSKRRRSFARRPITYLASEPSRQASRPPQNTPENENSRTEYLNNHILEFAKSRTLELQLHNNKYVKV